MKSTLASETLLRRIDLLAANPFEAVAKASEEKDGREACIDWT